MRKRCKAEVMEEMKESKEKRKHSVGKEKKPTRP